MYEEEWVERTLERMVNEFPQFPRGNANAYGSDLAGRLFEEMSYEYVGSLLPHFRLITSPTETFDFFRSLNPNVELVSDYFGPKAVSGVSVPDGLAYDTRWAEYPGHHGLCKVYEYTLIRPESFPRYLQSKVRHFHKLRELHPSLFSVAQLSMVVPYNHHCELPRKYSWFVHIETVPVSSTTIGLVINRFLQKRRGA